MPTEVQITNRNTLTPQRMMATLQDVDTGDSVLDFVIGPGEAVIIPMMKTMNVIVSVDQPGPDAAFAADGLETLRPRDGRAAN